MKPKQRGKNKEKKREDRGNVRWKSIGSPLTSLFHVFRPVYEQIFEPRRVEGTEWTGGIVRRETRTRETRVASGILELFSRCCHSILLHIGGVTLLESERDFDGQEIDCISAVVVAFFLRFVHRSKRLLCSSFNDISREKCEN